MVRQAVPHGIFHKGVQEHSGNLLVQQGIVGGYFVGELPFKAQGLQLQVAAQHAQLGAYREQRLARLFQNQPHQPAESGEVVLRGFGLMPQDVVLNGLQGVEDEVGVHLGQQSPLLGLSQAQPHLLPPAPLPAGPQTATQQQQPACRPAQPRPVNRLLFRQTPNTLTRDKNPVVGILAYKCDGYAAQGRNRLQATSDVAQRAGTGCNPQVTPG